MHRQTNMMRRSKIKVRPAIKNAKPSLKANASATNSQEKPQKDSAPTAIETHSEHRSTVTEEAKRIDSKLESLADIALSTCSTTCMEKSASSSTDVVLNANANGKDDGTGSSASKAPIARRRKLVACPTMARKRPKIATTKPDVKEIVEPKPIPDTETANEMPEAVIKPTDTALPLVIGSQSTDRMVMPNPVTMQVQVDEEIADEEHSKELTTLTTVTSLTFAAEVEVDDAVEPQIEPTSGQPVSSEEQNESSSLSKDTNNGSVNSNSNSVAPLSSAVVLSYENSSAEQAASNELKASGSITVKKAASKPKSVTAKQRKNALAKLKSLKLKQEEGCVWPELDQNVVSMSDLIFLNPPNKVGLKLGMNAERESVESTIIQRTETEAPQPETSTVVEKEDAPLPVPQIRIAEDGTVVIDEESLVLDTQKPPDPTVSTVYEFGRESIINQCSFLRRPYPKPIRWSQPDTDKFYRCLCIVGAEFSLMSAMFKGRSPDDLRRKFRRERKKNPNRVDKALMQQHLSKWTDDMFEPKEGSQGAVDVLKSPKPPEGTVQ